MKHTQPILILIAAIALNAIANARPTPLSNAFTYQGQLTQAGSPLNADADFQFTLFDAPNAGNLVAGPLQLNAVTVTNGRFTVPLDFGPNVFTAHERWLDIAVRSPAGSGSFTTLSPRQLITATPVSHFALRVDGAAITNLNASNITTGTLPSAAFSGNYGGAVNFTNPANVFGGLAFNGSGAGLNNLNASNITTGILPLSRGGTGAATAGDALTNLNAQARVIGSAPPGSYIRAINQDGTVTTALDADSGGDITAVTAGPGLSGGGTSGSVGLAVGNDAITPAMLASNANAMAKISGGIMTANAVLPSAHLAGSLHMTVNLPGNINPMLTLEQDGVGSVASMFFQNASNNGWAMGITPGNQLALNYNSNIDQSDLIRVSVDGRVGLGVLVPSFKLDLPNVASDAGGRGRANAWTTYSSIRWKESVERIDSALAKVMRLRGVTFNWTEAHGGGRDIGFIAEEVGAVVPELVSWEADGRFAQSMKYDRITALTVNALQELRAEKDAEIAAVRAEMQQENESLRFRLAQLEKMVEQLVRAKTENNR